MKLQVLLSAPFVFSLAAPGWSQNAAPAGKNAPIYQVTVIERTVRAVNYQYRGGPTAINFKGTVLLPAVKGDATVESKAGRTSIDAKLEHLTSPQSLGPGYLTYVLWAISPEGHAESWRIASGSSDKAKLTVTTDLQAFGMIVTAEPYSAVREPSDVVVAENEVRPDTYGKSEPIDAKYELLPRGHYTFNVPDAAQAPIEGPKVSMSRYESTLEVYQAENAVRIARSLDAERYAPEVMQKAEALLSSAREMNARKGKRGDIVMTAREAAETAEDARLIAIDRQRNEALSAAKSKAAAQDEALLKAQQQAQAAEADRLSAQELLDRERAARRRAEAQAAANLQPAPPPPAPPLTADRLQPQSSSTPEQRRLRVAMLRQFDQSLPTLDTPRGLSIAVADADFRDAALGPSGEAAIARIAGIVAAHPGLTVSVEGHTGSGPDGARERLSYQRAVAVRDALVRNGVPASSIEAHGLGSEQPVATNSTPAGRAQNRRIEIVVAGDPIGAMASWDRTYSVMPPRQ